MRWRTRGKRRLWGKQLYHLNIFRHRWSSSCFHGPSHKPTIKLYDQGNSTVHACHQHSWSTILAHCWTIFLKSSGYWHRNPNINVREIIWLGNQPVSFLLEHNHQTGRQWRSSHCRRWRQPHLGRSRQLRHWLCSGNVAPTMKWTLQWQIYIPSLETINHTCIQSSNITMNLWLHRMVFMECMQRLESSASGLMRPSRIRIQMSSFASDATGSVSSLDLHSRQNRWKIKINLSKLFFNSLLPHLPVGPIQNFLLKNNKLSC